MIEYVAPFEVFAALVTSAVLLLAIYVLNDTLTGRRAELPPTERMVVDASVRLVVRLTVVVLVLALASWVAVFTSQGVPTGPRGGAANPYAGWWRLFSTAMLMIGALGVGWALLGQMVYRTSLRQMLVVEQAAFDLAADVRIALASAVEEESKTLTAQFEEQKAELSNLARESSLQRVEGKVEKAAVAAERAYETANNVNTKIAHIAQRATDSEDRADVSERRADVAEQRADVSEVRADESERRAEKRHNGQ